MDIVKDYLPINGFSRTGKIRPATVAIVMHNVGVPGQRAIAVKNYFAALSTQDAMDEKPDISASAQYIVDQTGLIIKTMNDNEKAYHAGSSVYTKYAKQKFGEKYTSAYGSPNSVTIGIELCHEADGRFTDATIKAATELCAVLCKKYELDPVKDIITHYEIVGWKECPLLWTRKPVLLAAFREDVKRGMA